MIGRGEAKIHQLSVLWIVALGFSQKLPGELDAVGRLHILNQAVVLLFQQLVDVFLQLLGSSLELRQFEKWGHQHVEFSQSQFLDHGPKDFCLLGVIDAPYTPIFITAGIKIQLIDQQGGIGGRGAGETSRNGDEVPDRGDAGMWSDQRILPYVGRRGRGLIGSLDGRDLYVDQRYFVKGEVPLLKMSWGKLVAAHKSLDPDEDENHESQDQGRQYGYRQPQPTAFLGGGCRIGWGR